MLNDAAVWQLIWRYCPSCSCCPAAGRPAPANRDQHDRERMRDGAGLAARKAGSPSGPGGASAIAFQEGKVRRTCSPCTSPRRRQGGRLALLCTLLGDDVEAALPALNRYTASAKGIVVMVDAVDLLPNVNGTSELLLELFTDPVLMRKRVPVLVACNKTDRITAYSEAQVQKRLEREIQQLRSTREALTDTAEKGAKSDSLATKSKTKAGSTFKMDDAPLQVQFCEVSVLNDKV
eukprot:scaffold3505_cov385-Prasinococcus_capsulatus_cf.AAC.4